MKKIKKNSAVYFAFLAIAGCNVNPTALVPATSGTVSSSGGTNSAGGTSSSNGSSSGTGSSSGSSSSNTGSTHLQTSSGYPSCVTSDTNHICIALKVVSYLDTNSVPSITESQAVTLVTGMNQVWSTCNIAFQLEEYQTVDPNAIGFAYNPNWQSSASSIRQQFSDANKFVVIAVGSLSGSTIAVTEMPGGGPYGTLVEKTFATNPLTVGHELGHYQGLYHVSDSTNLMNPYIGVNTSGLTSSQCSTARSTDQASWMAMMR